MNLLIAGYIKMCVSVKMNSIEVFTLVTGDADEKATRRRKARERNIFALSQGVCQVFLPHVLSDW